MLLAIYSEYFGKFEFHTWEFLLLPIFGLLIFLAAQLTVKIHIKKNPLYKYYLPALGVRILGGIVFCMIYVYYYEGGDTMMYYESGLAMVNLMYKDPVSFLTVLFGENTFEKLNLFDSETGYPLRYMYLDDQTFFVVRFITPFIALGLKSYLLSTVLLSWASFSGVWRLYLLFTSYFKPIADKLAIAILFVPSVVFWGSGILKDSITLPATCWLVYSIYYSLIKREKVVLYLILSLVFTFIIISIKPYIFMTLLPGILLWVFYNKLMKLRNSALFLLYLPLIFVGSIGGGLFILSKLGESLSKFSLDRILTTAAITQQDLKQAYYSTNSFDIGTFDPSLSGIMSKAPLAINAGLFRPFLWESGNVVMLLSGLENAFILGLTIYIIVKVRPLRIIKIIFKSPLLLFSVSYSILFSFALGLTTSNFGALVRFKIPYLPFYLSSLFILSYFLKHTKSNVMEQDVKTVRKPAETAKRSA